MFYFALIKTMRKCLNCVLMGNWVPYGTLLNKKVER